MQVEDLIGLVEQCPHLYNRSLKSFKDDKMKENSWKSIAEYLNSDAITVRKRWENLRDRFVRAYRDYNNKIPSGSAGGSKKTVEFVYFQQMMWLGPFLRQQKLTSSIETTITKNIEEVVEDTAEETVNVDENSESEFQIFEMGSDGIRSPTPSIANCPGSSHSQRSTPSVRQEKAKVHERMTKAIDSFTEICKKKI